MILDTSLDNYIKYHFSAPNTSIYHYTNFLKEIVQLKYFKLSSHLILNEKGNAELTRGEQLIKSQLLTRGMQQVEEKFNLFIEKGIQVYTGSFTEGPNEHLAKQYKNRFCFKKEFIKKHIRSGSSIMLGHVKYDHKEHEKIISDVFKYYDRSPKNGNDVLTLLKWLCVIIPLLKESRFYQEKECRFVAAEIRDPTKGTLLTLPCPKEIEFNALDIRF